MSFVPATVDLTGTNQILQGTDWSRDFAVTSGGNPVDLTNYTGTGALVRCQFRSTVASTSVVLTPTMSVVSPATDGIIRMTIAASVTTALANTTQSGVYDVEIVANNANGNTVERIIEGDWSIDPEVTR